MKTCPNCNVTVTSEQRRCGNCGYALTPTHVSFKKTEPIISPPPTYIPPPSPHPVAKPTWVFPRINLPLRPRLLITGAVLLAIVSYIVFMLTRPPQVAGQWYGMLESQQGALNSLYAEVYLDLHVDNNGAITGTGEFCALSGNPSLGVGHRSPFTATGHLNGSQITLNVTANRFGGTPGSTSYLGTISGQSLGFELQASGSSAPASINVTLQHGSRSAYEAACAA